MGQGERVRAGFIESEAIGKAAVGGFSHDAQYEDTDI